VVGNLFHILGFVDSPEMVSLIIKDHDVESFLSIRDEDHVFGPNRICPIVYGGIASPGKRPFIQFFYGFISGVKEVNAPFLLGVVGRDLDEMVLDREEKHFGIEAEILDLRIGLNP